MRNSFKKLALGVVALGAFSLTACMSSGSQVGPETSDKNATIFVSAKMKNVNTLSKPGLGKLSPITLTTLRITAVSDIAGAKVLGEDSVVVEFAVGDSVGTDTLSHLATLDQAFNVELSLRPLRAWTVKVETIDDENSVIQTGTASLGNLFAGQVAFLAVNAGALYNNYAATFNFADSITSTTGSISRQDVKVTSFTMEIGADLALDSAAVRANGVATGVNHILNVYKVDTTLAGAASTDSVYIKVYGFLPQGPDFGGTAAAPIVLYSGTKALNELSTSTPTTVALNWVGPTTGVADLNVTVSKVGTIEIIVGTDPEVID
jgi:hypothetical protein